IITQHTCSRPAPRLLTRTSDCRIFQNQKVPDIIKQVFRDLGFSDFEDALTRPYREWEYLSLTRNACTHGRGRGG
ncbi:contractile injection system protein, VgrG/Pvc8 family, partial [Enterococcus faecalis]|uniref:contractile injection system protein, VgrG/Pvc8 family n=1 Tax=Enterococcus faecalis TaxID=1351 RepID=UPI0022A7FB4D